jgi:hypothetical protein
VDQDQRGTTGTMFVRNGAITVVALLVMFGAFDDITTDKATAFPVEYTSLFVCVAWLLFVTWSLFRTRHHVLGSISLLAVVTGVWAQRAIGPGIVPGWWTAYVVITAAYLWFWALSLTLLWLGWRTGRGDASPGRGSWFATFSLLDAGCAISSSQLQHLVASIRQLRRRTPFLGA